VPGVIARVTVDMSSTVFPDPSSIVTCGCVPNGEPPVAEAGGVVNASFVPASSARSRFPKAGRPRAGGRRAGAASRSDGRASAGPGRASCLVPRRFELQLHPSAQMWRRRNHHHGRRHEAEAPATIRAPTRLILGPVSTPVKRQLRGRSSLDVGFTPGLATRCSADRLWCRRLPRARVLDVLDPQFDPGGGGDAADVVAV
jgi:hypothetical protein